MFWLLASSVWPVCAPSSVRTIVMKFSGGIPRDCPFQRSPEISRITLTGRYQTYAHSDTYYLAWGGNGVCYSPFMDGDGADGYGLARGTERKLGLAQITGSDPMNLAIVLPKSIISVSSVSGDANARYACALLNYRGVLYYGSAYRRVLSDLGNHLLRPFAGFNISRDGGATWTVRNGALFPEKPYPQIKMGEPHLVDFGPDLKDSPDGKAYLVGHGHLDTNGHPADGDPHWTWGDAVYLARVSPSTAAMNDVGQYEFYAGKDRSGRPVWSKQFSRMEPLLSWKGKMGSVTITWHPGLKKYLMCVTDGSDWNGPYNSYFLTADALTSEWKIIDYWTDFGQQAYFLNLPSRFMAVSKAADGWHLWLTYSANWNYTRQPYPGSRYGFCLHEAVLKEP